MTWYVVTKTGQVVHSFDMTCEGKPDLSVYYEHPALYDVTQTPSQTQLDSYRHFWQNWRPSVRGL